MTPRTVELNGEEFTTLEEFFDHFEFRALDGSFWGRNLDAFNDVLRGGFGTPVGGFRIIWRNHALSREHLGYAETARQLKLRLEQCHPMNTPYIQQLLHRAETRQGETVFDWLVTIIQVHGPGGQEQVDNVELVLA